MQLKVGYRLRGEATLLCQNAVGTNCETGKHIFALAIGTRNRRASRPHIGAGDLSVNDHRPSAVTPRPLDGTCIELSSRAAPGEDQNSCQRGEMPKSSLDDYHFCLRDCCLVIRDVLFFL